MWHEVDEVGTIGEVVLVFEGVEAFKVTHYHARSDAMLEAYARLIDLGRTPWLSEVCANLERHRDDRGTTGLAHLMINFDDGPCYEVVCRSYRIERPAS
jgi:hypothetical protein